VNCTLVKLPEPEKKSNYFRKPEKESYKIVLGQGKRALRFRKQ
jgi:hypothetical protein